MAKKDYIVHRT